METHSSDPSDAAAPSPTAAQARAALDAVDSDASQLAGRLVTPWWYHPVLGALVAMMIGSQALSAPLSFTLIALAVAGIPVLTRVYTSRYGVGITQPTGPRSRRLQGALMAALVVLLVLVVIVKLASLPVWWVPVAAVAGFLVTVVLGRRYDAALRADLVGPSRAGDCRRAPRPPGSPRPPHSPRSPQPPESPQSPQSPQSPDQR